MVPISEVARIYLQIKKNFPPTSQSEKSLRQKNPQIGLHHTSSVNWLLYLLKDESDQNPAKLGTDLVHSLWEYTPLPSYHCVY